MTITEADDLARRLTTATHHWRIRFSHMARLPCPCGGQCVREARYIVTDGKRTIRSSVEFAAERKEQTA